MPSKIIAIRLNDLEIKMLKQQMDTYKINSNSTFIKKLIFADIKPFLTSYQEDLLGSTILELNAIGRNLNQLLKYKAYDDVDICLKLLRESIGKVEKIL